MRTAISRPALRVERLEDRATPAVFLFAVGSGAGGPPLVNVYTLDTPTSFHKVATFYAYEPAYRGGVNVAAADVNGDGVDDIITGPGPGRAPTVNVIDGASLLKGQVVLLRSFNAYDPSFQGGVYVAAGGSQGFTGTIVTGAGAGGGPHVREFDYQTLAITRQFYAYDPNFAGGVRVAVFPDGIITGAGPGGGPHVKIYNSNGTLAAQFYAFDPLFTGGVFVAGSGGLNSPEDDKVDIGNNIHVIVTAGAGGSPDVHLYDFNATSQTAILVNTVTPYPNFHGGVSAGVAEDDQDAARFLITGPGPGGGPDVRVFENNDFQPVLRFNAFDPTFLGGVSVGSAADRRPGF